MKAMKNLFAKLVRDEQGGEVLEYALIAGLIVVAAIAVIGSVGTKVLGRWGSLNRAVRAEKVSRNREKETGPGKRGCFPVLSFLGTLGIGYSALGLLFLVDPGDRHL